MKPTLLLDFDGTLHSYMKGYIEGSHGIDDPLPGALEFVKKAQEHFNVVIFSTRARTPQGYGSIERWLCNNDFPELMITNIKIPASIIIDDRAIQFRGTYPQIDELINFKPWNR